MTVLDLHDDPQLQRLLRANTDRPAAEVALKLCALLYETHGIRPSLNVVRPLLGRGSNTDIQRACNEYWRDLATRIRRLPRQLAMPDQAAEQMNALWQTALTCAAQQFEADKTQLATERAALLAERDAADLARRQAEAWGDAARQEVRAARDAEAAAREQARLADEARQSAERAVDDARLSVAAARQETDAATLRAEHALQAAEQRAQAMVAKVEEHYAGLRQHLLAETDRQRSEHQATHEAAMAELATERMVRQSEETRLRGVISDQRQQLADLKKTSAETQHREAALESRLLQQQSEIDRLQRHLEHLTRVLERLSPAQPPRSAVGNPSDRKAKDMKAAMVAAYRELADADGVVLTDWRLEAVERYQNHAGLDLDAPALFDQVLGEVEASGETGWRYR